MWWVRRRIDIGQRGEDAAAEFLAVAGYAVKGRNLKTPFGEIDILAEENGELVFVETKTRASSSVGPPYLSVTRKKQRKIIQNALSYLSVHGLHGRPWRIDVVSVKLAKSMRAQSIEIIKNAVEETGEVGRWA